MTMMRIQGEGCAALGLYEGNSGQHLWAGRVFLRRYQSITSGPTAVRAALVFLSDLRPTHLYVADPPVCCHSTVRACCECPRAGVRNAWKPGSCPYQWSH